MSMRPSTPPALHRPLSNPSNNSNSHNSSTSTSRHSPRAANSPIATFFGLGGGDKQRRSRSPPPVSNSSMGEKGAGENGNGEKYSDGLVMAEKGGEGHLDLRTETSARSDLNQRTTVTSTEPEKPFYMTATVIVPVWISLSAGIIVFNKWLYSTAGFPYPVFLTSYHLGAAALGTRVLRLTTPLMNGLDTIDMSREKYIRNIIPIGVMFSGSLILSNMAYLTLSVSFIQMLKAFHPVAILLISAAFKIQNLTQRLIIIVICISLGCAMAAYGELEFEMFGFLCQSSAVIFESSRLVMIQILLQGLKMDPLCSLHYYAPVCAIINFCFIPFTEGWAPFYAFARIGYGIMFVNAMNAFLLNVAAVFLISAAGGLVLTLAGVFKDILLISSSTLFFGSVITPIQIIGYGIALAGLVIFKTTGSK